MESGTSLVAPPSSSRPTATSNKKTSKLTTTTTTTTVTATGTTPSAVVLQSQLDSLDDTDCYATAWQQALERLQQQQNAGGSTGSNLKNVWGGRGMGGRGTARRTIQLRDAVVDGVRLEYVGQGSHASSRLLLSDTAHLKLLSKHVYAAVGRNGSGKSTLLKRLRAGKIPGMPPHLRIWYIAQDDGACFFDEEERDERNKGNDDPDDNDNDNNSNETTPLQHVLTRWEAYAHTASISTRLEVTELEEKLDSLDYERDEALIQELGERISQLEDDLLEAEEEEGNDDNDVNDNSDHNNHVHHRRKLAAQDALSFWGVDEKLWNVPWSQLSPGVRQKAALATALVCDCDLLLLDEPTKDLDVLGLVRLRQLLTQVLPSRSRPTTVLLVSHDLDLLNDVATDVIEFSDLQLHYYPGNYHDYLALKRQHDLHMLRQSVALDKKRGAMLQTLEHLKAQARDGASKKKSQQVTSQRKKIEKQGLLHDEKGHRWTAQNAGTGIQVGSINAVDASTRRGLTTQQLLQLTEKSVKPPPHKAVQFVFRNPTSVWGAGEPLIMAMQIGHGYPQKSTITAVPEENPVVGAASVDPLTAFLQPKPGYLFDCVDLCIAEGDRYCILGDNLCGKSVLLRLLAKHEEPLEGTVKHATNLDVGVLDQAIVDRMMQSGLADGSENALAYLSKLHPRKTEKDVRSELTNFGLSPQQAATNLRFLSGGERRRLCLAALMLGDPQVLMLDQPTSDLDMESVEALIYGLSRWKGTLVLVSHDANFVRALEAKCYALVNHRLYRVEGGIDRYLRSFATRV